MYYKSGVLKYEGRYIDGKPEGIHKSFYRMVPGNINLIVLTVIFTENILNGMNIPRI